MFDFRSMLPENMRHDFDAAAAAERERAAHVAACTLPLCDRCGRLACSSPGCGKLAEDLTEHIHIENNILFPRFEALFGNRM